MKHFYLNNTGHRRVMMVGSAAQSAGGVSTSIRQMSKMPVWSEFSCYWLGTQIQRSYLWKLWYAFRGNVVAMLIMWRYDIVHLHTTPDKLGLIIQLPILLLARLIGKKVIMQLHVGNQLITKKNSLFVFCLKKSHHILLLAKKWETVFHENYSEVKVPTSVLYNASERPLQPSEIADVLAQKEKLIIMAVWFNDNKAPDVLLKAILHLKENNLLPDGWKVKMLGNGEVERFKAMSDEMGLSDVVTFVGYVTGKERDEILRKSSIYSLCSYEEGFPMVVLESWHYCINVITTPVGGLPDVIEEGRNCLTFDFGDHVGLSYKLLQLMNDEEQRKSMAEYSYNYVNDNFSLGKISRVLKDLYESL